MEHREKLKSFLQRCLSRSSLFFSMVFALTFFQVWYLAHVSSFQNGGLFYVVWLLIFACLALNISLLLVQAFFALVTQPVHFSQVVLSAVDSVPVAIIYCIKNESFGLAERIRYTLEGNQRPGLDLWILSDSDDDHARQEQHLVADLRAQFGKARIFYRNRRVPTEKKQGNVKEWLRRVGGRYRFFAVCDADSLLPEAWVTEMLRIAVHQDNEHIGIFQSAIYITHEVSLYARMQAIGQYYAQKLYFRVNQAVFGHSVAFGHNCLIRTDAYQTIELPQSILSHDTWEKALLEHSGFRTVFVMDVISFEEATPHYLEARKRSKRWLKGTLQGWPLLFLPRISFSTRFLVFYQIYLFIVNPLLFFWMGSGFVLHRAGDGHFLTSEGGGLSLLIFTLSVLFLHKFAVARSWKDMIRITGETIFSTLLELQSIFYGTLDFLLLPFSKLGWTPMSKNPGEQPTAGECIRSLSLGTLTGIVVLWMGLRAGSTWNIFAWPILVSLILSIPSVYFTSKAFVRAPLNT